MTVRARDVVGRLVALAIGLFYAIPAGHSQQTHVLGGMVIGASVVSLIGLWGDWVMMRARRRSS